LKGIGTGEFLLGGKVKGPDVTSRT